MASSSSPRRLLVMITGASRGFGRSLATQSARLLDYNVLDMFLIARSVDGLAKTKEDVMKAASSLQLQSSTRQSEVQVKVCPIDLSDLDTLEGNLEHLFSQIDPLAYDKAFLFNNAGSLGPITYSQELPGQLKAMRQAVDLNVTSSLYMSALFTRLFGAARPDQSTSKTRPTATTGANSAVIVNVSSLAALQPFESWGVYCAGKAGRDLYHQVIAKEQGHSTKLKTLNYAPGPMDTDMQGDIRRCHTGHGPTRDYFIQSHSKGSLVPPERSAAKCLSILLLNNFVSGSHIDFFDD